jgi:CBS domain-containing protein
VKNSIAERIYDFLREFPPFDLLSSNDLMEISKEVKIIYVETGTSIFKKNDKQHSFFYVVRNGAIGLYREDNNVVKMVEICDAGDIFGIRPLITNENYILTATANEEAIVYGIPISIFQSVAESNKKINKFLITSFASNTYDPYTTDESEKIFFDYLPPGNLDILNLQTANFTKNPITCLTDTTVKNAAIKMRDYSIGCIVVVDREDFPVGVISSTDIKNKIATGLFDIDVPVEKIMSSPAITFPKDISIIDAQLQMNKNNIGHLCITKNGTPNSPLIGILSNHDLVVSMGNNPSVLLKEIKRSKRTKSLRKARNMANVLLRGYLEQNIPLTHISKIISEINDAVARQVVILSVSKMPTPPPVNFAWIALGSQGRKEQLLFTDQDNALIFEDVSEEKQEETHLYFLELSKLIVKSLHKIGYAYCSADMMANNPLWCKSLSEWKEQFNLWILNPDEKAILLSSIFFDFNYVYGDKNLVEELSESIFETTAKTTNFFTFLGKDAQKNPSPLGFFKQFVVETNGERKDFFNIKSRALMPLIDAARLLILSKNIKGINNTAERFEKLAALEPHNKELFDSCSYAFKALLKFRTKQGLLHNDSGKFIELATLTKEEKLKLKRCFKPIREVQELLNVRFKLANFI